MSQVFKCNNISFKVFVEDTDFQGVVYHANYLKYFERARSQFLNDYEISECLKSLKSSIIISNEFKIKAKNNTSFDVLAKNHQFLEIIS